ncbi:MAG TPA: TonB-dependent receptor [Xanthomonadaceae bacterium]|nr:TonB-dependent receptor [Xanthomonadaceae bacterium]
MKSIASIVFGLVLAASAHAQVALQPLTVSTAAREAEPADAALASVSVIDRDAIERSVAPDLVELLRLQAGVELARTGPAGSQTSLFLRGGNFNHVLVLVDGIRVSNVNTGAAAWENLPLAQIERIEIVRGPRAALYGSDAIGGVVQIFTRRLHAPHVRVQSGRYDSHALEAGMAAGGDLGGISVVAARRQSRGFSAQNERGFAFDPDRDGYRNDSMGVRADAVLGSQRIDAGLLAVDAEVEFDQGESSARTRSGHLGLQGALGEHWDHHLKLDHARENLATPTFFNAFRSRRHGLDWLHGLHLAPGQRVQFGVAWQQERGASLDTFGDTTRYGARRRNSAVFPRWRGEFGGHRLEVAGRHDDNSVFGGASTAQAAWGWQVTPHWRLLANFGQGFRAPNLNEQFSPGFSGLFAGNPDLEPERSRNFELGAAFRPGDGHEARLHLYRNLVRDLISFSGGDVFRAENIARARLEGVEFSHELALDSWRVRTQATWQNARDDDSGTPLRRRARRHGSLLAETTAMPVDLGVEVFASGARPDIAQTLPGYALLNLRARWVPSRPWTLAARMENVLDRDYEHAVGFNTPGRSLWLSLTWQGDK